MQASDDVRTEDILQQCSIELEDTSGDIMLRTCCNNKPLAVCRVSALAIAPLIIFTVVLVCLYALHKERIKKLNSLIYMSQLLIILSYISKHGYLTVFSALSLLSRPDCLCL